MNEPSPFVGCKTMDTIHQKFRCVGAAVVMLALLPSFSIDCKAQPACIGSACPRQQCVGRFCEHQHQQQTTQAPFTLSQPQSIQPQQTPQYQPQFQQSYQPQYQQQYQPQYQPQSQSQFQSAAPSFPQMSSVCSTQAGSCNFVAPVGSACQCMDDSQNVWSGLAQ